MNQESFFSRSRQKNDFATSAKENIINYFVFCLLLLLNCQRVGQTSVFNSFIFVMKVDGS